MSIRQVAKCNLRCFLMLPKFYFVLAFHFDIGIAHEYSLRIGMFSDVLGNRSSTTSRNTENDKRTVIPSEIFSPDSGGSQNTNRSMMDRRMMGMMTLTIVYFAFLSKPWGTGMNEW